MASSNNRTIVTHKPEFLVNPEDKSIRKGKSVVCLTTGAIFKSGVEAAREYGIGYSNLNANLRGNTKTAGGKKFMYISDLAYRVNDITSYIVELKANENSAIEEANRSKAEAQRFKDIWHSVQNTVDEAFTG